ncbi:peptidoglycan DD-metalloendopeptidase family protein [Haloimpatiens sp. FM7315]|uniref:peptidoglycan DD-metalloendopeptidase family protein n=1 Tax=Haloimpatiens sp. FM7315 TaxID=3298609 RepID=UPI0035A29757
MMNNNEKSSKTIRKEAIYVILFVCLCVAATAAAINSKNHKIAKEQAQNREKIEAQKQAKKLEEKEKKSEISLVDDSLMKEAEYENSLEVKNNKNKQATSITKNNEIAVSKATNLKMMKPVDGKLAENYSETPVYSETTGTYRPNFGINISAELGKKVVAVGDGVVTEVNENKNSFGQQVVIDHQNGLKSVYANLSKDIPVKVGQKIKQGEKVGEVGNTSLRSYKEKYGSNLHFEILKDNNNVNPNKYIKY